MTVSCNITCPSDIENLSDCNENIIKYWLIVDLSEDKVYHMNSGSGRNKFFRKFEIIDEMGLEFSESKLNFEQCSVNGTTEFDFNVTIHNFTSSMEGLMVICGLRRSRMDGPTSESYLINSYARLWQIPTGIYSNIIASSAPCYI